MALNRSKGRSVPMTEGSIPRHLLAYAIPAILGDLFQVTYNTVDSIIVGKSAGADALAAVGVANPLMSIAMFLIIGMGIGASVLMSEFYGAQDVRSLRREFSTTVIMSMGFSAVIALGLFLLANPLLRLVNTPPEIITGQVAPEEESIVVVGSGMTGLETAEILSRREKNNAVLVLEAAPRLAPGAQGSNRNSVTAVLEVNSVVFLVDRTLTRIGTDRVWFRDTRTGEEYVYPCDRVVLALGTEPEDPYGPDLQSVCGKVIPIGDRVRGGSFWDAIHAGYHAARDL